MSTDVARLWRPRNWGLAACGGLLIVLAGALQVPPAAAQTPLAAHPRDLVFEPLVFDPPQAAAHRHTLANGVPVFVVEDHTLPLVTVSVTVRTGSHLDPPGKIGLAALTGSQLRAGGAAGLPAAAFDEEVAYLAAEISSAIGATSGRARVNCLTKDLDAALELFFGMLRRPRFEQPRLDLAKRRRMQQMRRRNDNTAGIERREWARLLRGEHFSAAMATRQSIDAITREDLSAFHRRYYHPGGFVVAVSGNVTPAEILPKLEAWLADWPVEPAPKPTVPVPAHTPTPGLYFVDKPEVNQGRVAIGHLGTTRDNPDRHALLLMNDILGGGGFRSRLMARIRSDEGLAYSVSSRFGIGTYYDGVFRAGFQSRSATIARAAAIVMEEIDRIRSERVSVDELQAAKTSFIETFSRNFSSAGSTADLFAAYEYTGRDPDDMLRYRERIDAVSRGDVLRVAQAYLHPDALVLLVVGDLGAIQRGDPDHPQYGLEDLTAGPTSRIPLPDPYTMVYPAAP